MKASQSPVLNTRQLPVEDLARLSISKQKYTNLSNPTGNRNQKHFLVKECNRSINSSIFYHNLEFFKLTKEEKLRLIQEHHKKIADVNYKNQSRQIVFKYGEPIIPRKGIPFNGSLDVDWKPEDCNEEEEKNKTFDDLMELKHQSFCKSLDFENDGFASSSATTAHSEHHVKRQTYKELLDSDDDERTDDSNKPLPLKKTKINYFESSDEDIKSLQRPRKITSKTSTPLPNFCDRTNEIFENLKKQDGKKNKINTINSSFQKWVDNSGSSDSELDEDFYQKYNVNATVHKEQSSALTNFSSSSKLTNLTSKSLNLSLSSPVKTRSSNNKYSAIANAVSSTSKKAKNSLITASNSYEEKSSNKLNKHNNNKTNKCEDMIACPICFHSFPKTEIEDHAAKCEKFQDPASSKVCGICSKSFSNEEIATHRIDCIRQLTEQPNEETTTSFLCEVCQRYFINVKEIEHASKCIAKLRKHCK